MGTKTLALLLSVSCLVACASPTAPTQTSGSATTQPIGGSIQVPGSIPSADEPTASVKTHLQDKCTGGHLVYGEDGHGTPGYPVVLSFDRVDGAHVTATVGRDDGDNVTVELGYGSWTVSSVPASGTSDPNGYQLTISHVTVPDEGNLLINQIRNCFVGPPVPPGPVPPIPVPPVPPPSCSAVNPPYADAARWTRMDLFQPIQARQMVHNAGKWALVIVARYTDSAGHQTYYRKAVSTITLACGQSFDLTTEYALWGGHQAQEWRTETELNDVPQEALTSPWYHK